jgi:hypothetical protein
LAKKYRTLWFDVLQIFGGSDFFIANPGLVSNKNLARRCE